jgi:hypothetical protein
MDIRKTGYAVEVKYRAADGSVKIGHAPMPGRKEAFKRFHRFTLSDETIEVRLIQNGKVRLRSVRDLAGKMVIATEEIALCLPSLPPLETEPSNGSIGKMLSRRAHTMAVLADAREMTRKQLLQKLKLSRARKR